MRRAIRFLAGLGVVVFWVWGVIAMISGGDAETPIPLLLLSFAVYFIFDTKIRITDLEKWVKDDGNGEHLDNWNCVVTIHEKRNPNPPKVETEEGKETT